MACSLSLHSSLTQDQTSTYIWFLCLTYPLNEKYCPYTAIIINHSGVKKTNKLFIPDTILNEGPNFLFGELMNLSNLCNCRGSYSSTASFISYWSQGLCHFVALIRQEGLVNFQR